MQIVYVNDSYVKELHNRLMYVYNDINKLSSFNKYNSKFYDYIVEINDLRSEIVESGYLPLVFDETGSQQYILDSREDKYEHYINYNLYIRNDRSTFYNDNFIISNKWFDNTELQVNQHGYIEEGMYESSSFSMWFTHIYLLGLPISDLNKINVNLYTRILNKAFKKGFGPFDIIL